MLPQACLSIAVSVVIAPALVWAHSKEIYATKQAALEQASQLRCQGAHQNNGAWMPCLDEADLHRAQRRQ